MDYNTKDNDSKYVTRHTKKYHKTNIVVDDDDFSFDNDVLSDNTHEGNHRNIFSIILIIIFLVIIGFSLYKIILWGLDNYKTRDISKRIKNDVDINVIKDSDDTELISQESDKDNPYWYYINYPLIDVDVSKLKKENRDTVGWINVNNTNINYPFVQTKDNDYYLTHSFSKEYNEAGWLFLDYRNHKDFSNKNNIIYGHSRLNKTMFGSLSRVLKSSWYSNKDNHIIRISLENESTLWQIFSVYKIKTESYYITTDFDGDNDYIKFLDTIKKRSIYDFDVHLSKSDKILTLSTCYSDTERTVVHARLIKKSNKL